MNKIEIPRASEDIQKRYGRVAWFRSIKPANEAFSFFEKLFIVLTIIFIILIFK